MRPRRRRSPGCVAVVARDLHRVPCLTIAWSTLLAGLFTALNAEPTAFGCGRPATDRRAPGEFSELSRTRRTALGQDGVLGVYASAGHTLDGALPTGLLAHRVTGRRGRPAPDEPGEGLRALGTDRRHGAHRGVRTADDREHLPV